MRPGALRSLAGPVLVVVAACAPTAAPPNIVDVTSGPTTVRVQLDPFALVVERDGTTVARSASLGGDCAALAVALRKDDDEGRYHRADAPEADLAWLHAATARRVIGRPASFEVDFVTSENVYVGTGGVEVSVGAHDFVDVDASFPFEDRAMAFVSTCFTFPEGAHAVGGGEVFAGADLAGTVVPLAFAAPGRFTSSTNEAHAPIPFIATTTGLGLLVETERPGAFDVGATTPGALVARFHGNTLPLRITSGPMKQTVAAHARRMGLPPMPPRWALAPMQWRNEAIVDDVATGRDRVLADARMLRALDLPTTTLWIDAPWQTGYNTFRFNDVQFPDARAMIHELERLGFRVLVWATEHVNVSDDHDQMPGMPPFASQDLYDRFAARDHLVQTAQGAPLTFPWGRGQGSFVDFTNEEASAAWGVEMAPLLDLGVRGFKLDYGEMMRADILGILPNDLPVFADGTTTEVQHTRYSRLYHEAYLAALQSRWPGDHFVITRSGGIFDQKNGTAIWPGDLDNDFLRAGEPDLDDDDQPAVGGLPAAVGGALSLSMSGYPMSGSDIGGYRGGAPTTEVLVRWAQFGAVSVIMQLGGGGTGDTTHNPWDARYDDGTIDPVAAYRRSARLHMDLVPTLEALLFDATSTGAPPLVPTGVANEGEAGAWADRDSFLLGDDLLAAPVVESATTRAVFFPPGTWWPYFGGAAHEGPRTQTVDAPLDTLPLYVRAGAVVVMGDPRLMTLVDALDEAVADDALYGAGRVVLASPGPASTKAMPDGVLASQSTQDGTTTVVVDAPSRRMLAVDLRGVGPSTVRVDGAEPAAAANESALLSCFEPCVLVEGERVRVAASRSRLVVEVSE